MSLLILVVTACQLEGGIAQTPIFHHNCARDPQRRASSRGFHGAGDFSVAICQVAQRVKPAVVQITNDRVQVDQFNQPFTVPAGVGSGVIYDSHAHIRLEEQVKNDYAPGSDERKR